MSPLWYSPPEETDEADGSWLMRAGSLYGVSPLEMYLHLRRFEVASHLKDDLRAVTSAAAAPVASAGGASREYCDLGSYCPLCIARDFRRGRIPHFRRAWHRVWTTHCHYDRTPLFYWPYRDHSGQLVFPPWMAQLHFDGGPMESLDLENQEILLHLRYARKVRRWMGEGAPTAMSWLQQLEQEQILLNPSVGPTHLVAGVEPRSMRRVVADTVTLLCNPFGASERCQASYLAGFLGPKWLFSRSFANSGSPSGHGPRGLRSFVDPARRRSLITLALRLHSSFAVDPEFDRDAQLVGVGETSLSRALTDRSAAAAKWVSSRAQHWPRFSSLGIRNALRCDP